MISEEKKNALQLRVLENTWELNKQGILRVRNLNCFTNIAKNLVYERRLRQLVGYPDYFKFNKPRKGNFGNHQDNSVDDQDFNMKGSMTDLVNCHGFSTELCEKLIQMFKSVQTGSTTTKLKIPFLKRNLVLGDVATRLYVMKNNSPHMKLLSEKSLVPVSLHSSLESMSKSISSKSNWPRGDSVCLLSSEYTELSSTHINKNVPHLPLYAMKHIKRLN